MDGGSSTSCSSTIKLKIEQGYDVEKSSDTWHHHHSFQKLCKKKPRRKGTLEKICIQVYVPEKPILHNLLLPVLPYISPKK
mmetsp:Transcript_35928/g.62707  ORF Transcript_35928/g.62707 Transcript_35928/m.62707 type:complete len:81 (-) Transcript_35928:301-543(-)